MDKMENQRKVIIGYDLCDDYSQISLFSYKTFEPISICPNENQEDDLIPTVLCIKNDTKLWSYGWEAVNGASGGNGILVDHLLSKVKSGEEVEIFGQRITGVALLEKFLRKSLILVKNYFPNEVITKLVITLREPDPKIIEGVYEALELLGIEKDRAVVMNHAGAYMYYALSQDRALWVNDVALFDFNEQGLNYYQISVSRRTNPMIAGMERKEFTDTLSLPMLKQKGLNTSYAFENIANTVLYKQIISTIYFTGEGFKSGWADEVIKGLCTGRRVFVGQNLYSKGACFAAKELSGDRKLADIILLNSEMLVSSIWIRVYTDAVTKEIMLTDAAIPWYEVDREIEVIPENIAELEIILRNILTKEITRERLHISNLPNRPERMTRLGIHLCLTERSKAKITVTDLGFGEIYPETGQIGEFIIDI
ncbi:MAG TPA: DUF5716 family protein [Mobilitalea sp.]|nr:DUF5716 family protein [Mobilitalea sp.]